MGPNEKYLSAMSQPDVEFKAGLAVGELRYTHCHQCGRATFYPRVVCPACGSANVELRPSEGNGVVYSSSAITSRDADPYSVTLVDLPEGFRMLSSVQGIRAEDVTIGMAVRLSFDTDANGDPRAVFVPEVEK
jgi:uncharacterized OB-fold protein